MSCHHRPNLHLGVSGQVPTWPSGRSVFHVRPVVGFRPRGRTAALLWAPSPWLYSWPFLEGSVPRAAAAWGVLHPPSGSVPARSTYGSSLAPCAASACSQFRFFAVVAALFGSERSCWCLLACSPQLSRACPASSALPRVLPPAAPWLKAFVSASCLFPASPALPRVLPSAAPGF